MRKTFVRPLIVASILIFVVAFAACSSESADDQSADTSTATLEQVLDGARLAMGDVVTYKTRGRTVDTDSTGISNISTRSFTEFHSYDRYKFGDRYPEDEGAYFMEWLVVGSQSFSRNSDPEWQELEPSSEPRTPTPPSVGFLSFLYEDGLALVSTDEVTEDGVSVYRFESTEQFEHAWGGDQVSETLTTSLLIDKESFRIVTRIVDKNYRRNIVDATEGERPAKPDWWQTVFTEHYYDYNQPVVIEVPDEYVPWSDDAVLSSTLSTDSGPAR